MMKICPKCDKIMLHNNKEMYYCTNITVYKNQIIIKNFIYQINLLKFSEDLKEFSAM